MARSTSPARWMRQRRWPGPDGERRDRGGDLRRRGRRVEGAGQPDADRHRPDDAGRRCHHHRGAELRRAGDAGGERHPDDDERGARTPRPGDRRHVLADVVHRNRCADAERDHDQRQPDAEHDRAGDAGRRHLHDHRRRQSLRVPGSDDQRDADIRPEDQLRRGDAGQQHGGRQQRGQWRARLHRHGGCDNAGWPGPDGERRDRR